MKKVFKSSLSVAAIAVLAACGGGDETPANPIAKYAGTYYAECSPNVEAGTSGQASIKINDLGSGNFAFEIYQSSFKDVACSESDKSEGYPAGTITLLDSEKFKFSNFQGYLPPAICATKNEEVSIDRVRVAQTYEAQTSVQEYYFYKTNNYLFIMQKGEGEYFGGDAAGTDPNFSTDSFVDCSAPPA